MAWDLVKSLGRFIANDGANVPQANELEELIRQKSCR